MLFHKLKFDYLIHNIYFEMIAFNDYICRHLLLSSLNNVSYLHMKRFGIFQLLALEPEIRTTDYFLFSMPQCFHLEFATHKDLMTCFHACLILIFGNILLQSCITILHVYSKLKFKKKLFKIDYGKPVFISELI